MDEGEQNLETSEQQSFSGANEILAAHDQAIKESAADAELKSKIAAAEQVLNYCESKPKKSWAEKGLNVEQALNSTSGPFVEVGGPTTSRSQDSFVYDPKQLQKQMYTSNVVAHPVKHEERTTGSFLRKRKEIVESEELDSVDFQADATRLPLQDSGVGALFCTALPGRLRGGFIEESARTIEPGGYLIFQAVRRGDVQHALESGFDLVKAQLDKPKTRQTLLNGLNGPEIIEVAEQFDVVMRKPLAPSQA